MLLRSAAFLLLVVGQVSIYACLGPDNVFGIRLNNGESIDVSAIENLGEQDINYYKNDKFGVITYSFRSHYNPSIMVTISIENGSADLSGVLSFTVDTSTVSLSDLPSGTCVRAELDWLMTAGILEMERIKRERIEQSFNGHCTACFFWTRQDSLIPNNWMFGTNMDDEYVVAMADCGETDFAVTDLPPQSLDIVVGIAVKDTKAFSGGSLANASDRSSMLLLVDINGRVVQGQKITGLKSNRSGVFVGFDRRTGAVRKVMVLP